MQTAGARWTQAIGPICIINLPERRDRRAEMARSLQQIGLGYDHAAVHLQNAIRPTEAAGFPTIGAYGCFLSHLATLKRAVAEDWPAVTIFEDDLDFPPNAPDRLNAAVTLLEDQPWDILYPSYHPVPALQSIAPGLARVAPETPVVCAHFVVFRRSALVGLVPYLEAILTRAPGDAAGGPMHVDGAYSHFRADHPELVTLALDPALGFQRASRTDIHDLPWWDRIWPLRGLAQAFRVVKRRMR